MDEFLIQLQAILDNAKSEENIKQDINRMQNRLDKLKIQAELDPKVIQKLATDIGKLLNQKITISNIGIDTNHAIKNAQQSGQQIGNTINKSVQKSLNVDDVINNAMKRMSQFKGGSAGVIFENRLNSIRDILKGDNKLLTVFNESISQAFNSDSLNNLVLIIKNAKSEMISLEDITKQFNSTINSQFTTVIPSSQKIGTEIFEICRAFQQFDTEFQNIGQGSGKKFFNWLSTNASQAQKDIFNVSEGFLSFQKILNSLSINNNNLFNYTTTLGLDTLNFNISNIEQLLQAETKLVSESNQAEKELQELRNALISTFNINTNPDGTLSVTLDQLKSISSQCPQVKKYIDEINSNLIKVSQTEKTSENSSTSSTNTIVQNEKRKQEAYKATANIQRQSIGDKSLIKSGANVTTFEHTNNAAREASAYFSQLLKDENAVISVSERFGNLNGLTSFTVNIKRATGEVESLRYALNEIKDTDGNNTGQFRFVNKGGVINDANAVKQLQRVENEFANYTQKLAQFKSTNNNILSGLSSPLSDFESKLSGLRNGTVTIDELRNSFSMLKTEASKITSNLSGELNKIDKAVRNISKGKETIAGLKAEFNGLHNKPKDINAEINKLSSGLQNIKKIESQEGRSVNWTKAYKEWEVAIDSLSAKLKVLKKEQSNIANTQIFNISDLRKAKIPYMSKVSNTTEKQMEAIQKMSNAYGWQKFDVKSIERADGLIKKLTLTITDAEGAIKRLNFQRVNLKGNGKTQAGLMQTGDVQVIKTASKAQEELAQSAAKTNAKLAEQANKIQFSIKTGEYESKIASLIAKTQQWTTAEGNARISTTNLSTALIELDRASEAYANNPSEAMQRRLIESSKKLDAEYKKVTNSVRKMNAEIAKDSSIASLHNKVSDFMSKNGKAVKYSGEFQRIFNETAKGAQLTREQVVRLNQEFNQAVVSARNAGKLGKTFFQTMKDGMSSFSYWTSSTFIVMKTFSEIRQAVTTVKELDTALVDLKKTTTMTSSELEQFYYDANDVAKQMGVTTKEIIDQASAWSRLGYSSNEAASKMAKYSSMFASISPGMDVDTATNGLVSIMKAFDIGNENPDDVLDGIISKINIIGNTAATSNAEIVNMLARSSSAMKEANNTLEETIGLETAAVEITRDDASVGTAFKTVSMRIRGRQILPPYTVMYMLCA